jgi:hypothetical protein
LRGHDFGFAQAEVSAHYKQRSALAVPAADFAGANDLEKVWAFFGVGTCPIICEKGAHAPPARRAIAQPKKDFSKPSGIAWRFGALFGSRRLGVLVFTNGRHRGVEIARLGHKAASAQIVGPEFETFSDRFARKIDGGAFRRKRYRRVKRYWCVQVAPHEFADT